MKSRVWFALFLLSSAPLWAGLNFALGPGGGLGLPLGGNIRNYQPALDAGLDVRLTGFQPVVGLALTGGYVQFKGPSSSNPANDSSKFTYRYFPTALCPRRSRFQPLRLPSCSPQGIDWIAGSNAPGKVHAPR